MKVYIIRDFTDTVFDSSGARSGPEPPIAYVGTDKELWEVLQEMLSNKRKIAVYEATCILDLS